MDLNSIDLRFLTADDGTKTDVVIPFGQFEELRAGISKLAWNARYERPHFHGSGYVTDGDGNKTGVLMPCDRWASLIANTEKWEKEAKDRAEGWAFYVTFYMPRKDVRARALWYPLERRFLMLKGSETVRHTAPSMNSSYRQEWMRLQETGILIEEGHKLVFTADRRFSSPSKAASIVGGNSRSGKNDSWEAGWSTKLSQLRVGVPV